MMSFYFVPVLSAYARAHQLQRNAERDRRNAEYDAALLQKRFDMEKALFHAKKEKIDQDC